ncbi:MAG TPA: cbb3-type cytochrome c oxidase subunit II [Chthoniobacterales bacterium]|jgi:cbb3-type cytochrome oxidase cytochrome c subunit
MKGLQPLFLGIFGIFTFSWLGMTVVPNLQIGSLNPQSDEEGTDVYPMPPSGMALRGAQVYAANGCVYCHTQQVRPEYGGSDLERKWGDRRSAPRDYIFEPKVLLGKMRTGPDLANVGHRTALADAASPTPAAGAAAAPAPGTSPAAAASPAAASPAASPATTVAAASPAASPAAAPGAPAILPPAGSQPAANVPTSAPSMVADVKALTKDGKPIPYTAAWHHRHLYNPRSIAQDSNMPAYRFLYEKHRISGELSPDAINFAGDSGENPEGGWEIVPSYDAKCLVAYLMSLDQSHPLKEAKAPATVAAAPAAATEAKK